MIRFVIILLTLSSSLCHGGDLLYEFSFGDHLYLNRTGQRISLTVHNPTDQFVECAMLSLGDGGSPHFIEARLGFRPVEGSSECFGGYCAAIFSPPTHIVIWASVGPYAPGESKTCDFDVVIQHDFSGTIELSGDTGPIKVTRVDSAVPTLSIVASFLLFCAVLLVGLFFHARRQRIA